MGKPTGFIEFERSLPSKRTTKDRLHDYKEFVHRYTEGKLNEQSARCMDCGVPFCNNGCPLGNNIPSFNDAVYNQDWEQAYAILASTNNFPEFTGRICPAPCESACVLGINSTAVTIEEIEKHIIEIAFEHGFVKAQVPQTRTGKLVAIIGSGPAGLAAAAQLNSVGHEVTVFEKEDAVGGLLRYGIPDFKLEKWIIDRRIAIMMEEGIVFKCSMNIGVTVDAHELFQNFDTVILATGSSVPRDLNIPGRQLNGVHFAMNFLKAQNRSNAENDKSEENLSNGNRLRSIIQATGKNVIVIGGGDTGSDCVGTANRQGATSVTQLELLPKPPESRSQNMPWPTYPMLLKTTSSHEEGVERQWAVGTKAFISDDDGNLKALRIVALEWQYKHNGEPDGFVEIPGTEKDLPCELVLLAMGFLYPQKEGLISSMNIETNERGNVRASEFDFKTNVAKVFTAGDMRRGQSLVVWAISEGRECARKVDESLMGYSHLASKNVSKLESYFL